MEGSHYFLKSLGLESYMGQDPLPRVDMEGLVYPSMPAMPEAKMKDENHPKSSDPIKDVLCDRQDGIADEMAAANVQADDFFSSLELQSSSKTSSNLIGLSFANKSAGGIITRSRFSSSTSQETGKAPGEKTASKAKAKGRQRRDKRRRGGERAAGRRAKAKGKGKKLQSGKKLPGDGREKVSTPADAKRQNCHKSEETVLEKSLALEKSNDDDWVLFNNLTSKKEIDDKMFDNKQMPSDLQNPVRRCTPELFSMSSILMSDGLSEGKDDVDNLLEAEDFHDSFLEEMEEFTYAPPRSHTGGKWKPGSLSIRTSPMLWDNFLDEGKPREAETPSDSPTESLDRGEKFNKLPPATAKWRSFAPPATHTTGKWKPLTPPASYTGGKWKPSEFPQRLKKSDQELLSPDDAYEADRETDVSPAQVGGKWKPGSELWKAGSSSNLELDARPPTRGKWGSTPGKSSVNRSTLDVLASSQSTSGKCLKTSGGMIQYYCSPCNRRLSCKKMYRKHVQSELHFKRVLQENELEFDSRSLKLFHGLFTQAGCRGRGLGKRPIKRPETYGDAEVKTSKREKKAAMKLKGKRAARRELIHCEVCRVKVPSHLWGKHLVSYCHSRRFQPGDPEQQKLILDNIHAIVKQAPYQCGICKFYCNTHASFKKHWALSVHKEVEQSKRQRFWCALCSFESDVSRSMELHLDSNSHREVILAVNKSIPIIIRHKVIFNCDICFKEFRFNRELIRHKEIFHEKADNDKKNKFVCPTCRHSCKSMKSLQRHTLKSHKNDMKIPYFCSACNEFFTTAEEAKVHRNAQAHKLRSLSAKAEGSDKDTSARSCSYCRETLEDLTKLKSHLLERHTDLLPKCFKCGVVFALSQEVSRHVKSNECDFARESPRLSSPAAFACESCAFATNSKSEFLLHSALHQKKDKDEKKISCPICGSLFTQTSLSIHLRTHLKERTYECSACSKAFVRKDRYVSHLKLKHGTSEGSIARKKEDGGEKRAEEEEEEEDDGKGREEEKPNAEEAPEEKRAEEKLPERSENYISRQSCGDPKCRYVAKDLNDWENHCLFHVGPKKYQCPECFYSTKTNTVIKRHYLIHFDERSFPCHLCSFKARLKSHLKRHMRLHTGAKPYKCPYCPYTCNILENLRKHVLHTKLHPGKKMYECKLCGFDTNVAIDFKRHLAKCHKGDSRLGEANEAAGIYSKEEDSRGLSSPLPVKSRASTSQTKKAHSESFLKKVNLLTQRNTRIAPKPSFSLKKLEPPSLNFKSTGNLVEDKRKILKMELEKLKNQIKPPKTNSPRSYPSPAEKDLKIRAEKTPEEKDSDAAGNILSLVTMPTATEETSSKATGSTDSTLPQMEFSSVCILYENALPSEEIELNLLENYQV